MKCLREACCAQDFLAAVRKCFLEASIYPRLITPITYLTKKIEAAFPRLQTAQLGRLRGIATAVGVLSSL